MLVEVAQAVSLLGPHLDSWSAWPLSLRTACTDFSVHLFRSICWKPAMNQALSKHWGHS